MGTEAGAVERVVRFRAVHAETASVVVKGGEVFDARRDGDWWTSTVRGPAGCHYWITLDGGAPLIDAHCADLELTPEGPRSVLRGPWPTRPRATPSAEPPVVYELHVKGFGGSYLGCIEHLDHVVSTGANVIELMPVHSFDDRDNYWGYMPIVWGAVHRGYAGDPSRAAEELAELVQAAHERGLHVWLDVVFNHTAEHHPPTLLEGLRHLDPGVYRADTTGRLTNDSGCGNDIDPGHPWATTCASTTSAPHPPRSSASVGSCVDHGADCSPQSTPSTSGVSTGVRRRARRSTTTTWRSRS